MASINEILSCMPEKLKELPTIPPVCRLAELRTLRYYADSVAKKTPVLASSIMIGEESAEKRYEATVIKKPDNYGRATSLVLSCERQIYEGMIVKDDIVYRPLRRNAYYRKDNIDQDELVKVLPSLDRLGLKPPTEEHGSYLSTLILLLGRMGHTPGLEFVENITNFNAYLVGIGLNHG